MARPRPSVLFARVAFVVLLFAASITAPTWFVSAWAQAPERVRAASYNIEFLNTSISSARRDALQQVIAKLDADVIGLEEIADRPALANIFPTQDWNVIIDDDSDDPQDLAVAVRKQRFDVLTP